MSHPGASESDPDEVTPVGCCSWFSSSKPRRTVAERKYQAPPETPTAAAAVGEGKHDGAKDAKPDAATTQPANKPIAPAPVEEKKESDRDSAAAASIVAEAKPINESEPKTPPPTEQPLLPPKQAFVVEATPVPDAIAASSPSPAPAHDFLHQWLEAVQGWNSVAGEKQDNSSDGPPPEFLRRWMAEQGFAPLLELLQHASVPASRPRPPSPTQSPAVGEEEEESQQLQGGGEPGDLGARLELAWNPAVTTHALPSPPATLRWNRRQTWLKEKEHSAGGGMPTVRAQGAHAYGRSVDSGMFLGGSSLGGGETQFLMDRMASLDAQGSIVELERQGSTEEGSADAIAGGEAEQQQGGQQEKQAPLRIPLDLSSAQELNQRAQMTSPTAKKKFPFFPPGGANSTTTLAAAVAPSSSPFFPSHGPSLLCPFVFQPVDTLAEVVGEKLADQVATWGEREERAEREETPESGGREEERGKPHLETRITPSLVRRWIASLVALLKQFAPAPSSPTLTSAIDRLLHSLFPLVPPCVPVRLVELDPSAASAEQLHAARLLLRSWMRTTTPILQYYASPASSMAAEEYFASNSVFARKFPPREFLLLASPDGFEEKTQIGQFICPALPATAAPLDSTSAPSLDSFLRKLLSALLSLSSASSAQPQYHARSNSTIVGITTRSARFAGAGRREQCVGVLRMLERLESTVHWARQLGPSSAHPFPAARIAELLSALMQLFWNYLQQPPLLSVEADMELWRKTWRTWYSCVEAGMKWLDNAVSYADLSGSKEFYFALRFSLPTSPAPAPAPQQSIPSLSELLHSVLSLLFDPLLHPYDLSSSSSGDDSDSASLGTSLLDRVRQAGVECLINIAKVVRSEGFRTWQTSAAVESRDLTIGDGADVPPPSSLLPSSKPVSFLLQDAWFWDVFQPLFAPGNAAGGAVFEWVKEVLMAEHQEEEESDSDDEGSEVVSSPNSVSSSTRLLTWLCSFLSQVIFAPPPPSSSCFPPCPYLLSTSWTSAWLHCVSTGLRAAFHSPLATRDAELRVSALAQVLSSAAGFPPLLHLPHGLALRYAHLHVQLYHLGIAAWIANLTGLEEDCGEGNGEKAKEGNGVAELNRVEVTHVREEQETKQEAQIAEQPPEEDQPEPKKKKKAKKAEESGSYNSADDDDDSDFSEINFEDSDEEYYDNADGGAGGLEAGFKLAISNQGGRHINERFALGMDGQPLHPDGFMEEEQAQAIADAPETDGTDTGPHGDDAAGSARSRGSGSLESSADLGSDGWGDSDSELYSTAAPAAAPLALKIAMPQGAVMEHAHDPEPVEWLGIEEQGGGKGEEEEQEEEEEEEGGGGAERARVIIDSAPASSSAEPINPASYSFRRSRHLLYRSRAIHSALVDLLLTFLLDPSLHRAGLNELYCSRFPLAPTQEQKERAERIVQLNAQEARKEQQQMTEDSLSMTQSFDDLPSMNDLELLQPLGINILYNLSQHVNHRENAYLCSDVLRAFHSSLPAPTPSPRLRLIKLLFSSLFSPSSYINRTQIGRGRYASVYSTQYKSREGVVDPKRYALKQVELPATPHDQMLLVDLFIEISILEDMSSSSSSSSSHDTKRHTGILPLIDYGVGDGCIWIVMPLASTSLKGWKVANTLLSEEDQEYGRLVEKEKGLMKGLLQDVYAEGCVAKLLDAISSPSFPYSSSLRSLLASLCLFHQILAACLSLEEKHIVHFDIKADNVLVYDQDSSSSSSSSSLPLLASLADFGEAMYCSSDDTVAGAGYSVAPVSGGLGELILGGISSKISRGTENIQSPEMSTLIRSMDRSSSSYDRRRRWAGDSASDAWSIGCLFYEIVVHPYQDPDARGQGLLFEEAAGLPLFLQITSGALPVLSEEKREFLLNSKNLPAEVIQCQIHFLEFILKRDRLQRPSFDQISLRLRSVLSEILAAAIPDLQTGKIVLEEKVIELKTQRSSLSETVAQAAAPSVATATSAGSCLCAPPPASWTGSIPVEFKCEKCEMKEGRMSTAAFPLVESQSTYFLVNGNIPVRIRLSSHVLLDVAAEIRRRNSPGFVLMYDASFSPIGSSYLATLACTSAPICFVAIRSHDSEECVPIGSSRWIAHADLARAAELTTRAQCGGSVCNMAPVALTAQLSDLETPLAILSWIERASASESMTPIELDSAWRNRQMTMQPQRP